MKRLSLIALLALVACNSNATVTAVSLPGPNALAVGGRTLFVANTDADELRALNLSTTPRTFVRAPNPLYPLGIPTAPFPRALAAFTGTDGTTPVFSFALSTAGAQVTVVSNETLAALGAFVVPDTTLAIATTRPVTATDVRLVLAAVQGSQGALWTASLSADLKKNYQAIPAIKPAPAISLGASSPQVLVPSPSNPDLVAVGDRVVGPDGFGRQGGLALCDLSDGSVTRLDVGGPVSALAFNLAGDRLFGLLDSEACALSRPCSGLFAIDVSAPKSPVLLGSTWVLGTAQGLAVGGAANVTLPTVPDGTENPVLYDPLVIVSSSDGSIYVYDGAAIRPVDVGSGASPSVAGLRRVEPNQASADYSIISNTADGPQLLDEGGNPAVGLTLGVTMAEEVWVTWEGALVRGGSGALAAGALTDAFDFVSLGVQPGDLVVFPEAGACPDGPDGNVTATVTTVAPGWLGLDGCLPRAVASYVVRAAQIFVVSGTRSGYRGRVSPEASFSGGGLAFAMGTGAPLVRDAAYVLTLDAGLIPFAIPVGATTLSIIMPGPATFDPLGAQAVTTTCVAHGTVCAGLFYVAFQGGNAVIEVDPSAMRAGSTSVGLATFR